MGPNIAGKQAKKIIFWPDDPPPQQRFCFAIGGSMSESRKDWLIISINGGKSY
jgi:hypothetical protein